MLQSDLTTIITYNPWALTATTTCGELLEMLGSATFHHWPVVDDDRRLVGVVSNIEFVRVIQSRAAAVEQSAVSWDDFCSRPVSEIMSSRIVTIVQDEYLANVIKLFREHGINSLPVLEDFRLIGLITTSDLLREFAYSGLAVARETVVERMKPAGEPIDCSASIDEAAMAMRMDQKEFIGVVRGDLPLGVISHRDLLMAKLRETVSQAFEDIEPLEGPRTLLELAAAAPTIRPGERLSTAATRMVEHRRQTAAVTNQAGRLLGVVTEDTILGAMLEALQ